MRRAPTRSQIRALVIDDSRTMRRLIASALEAEGDICVAGEASDAAGAMALIEERLPEVITLDVEMPGMNGIALLREIMERRPIPVVMVSTLTAAGTDVTLEALRIGAVDAVAKPPRRDALKAFARELRDKVRVASAARVRRRPGRGGPAPALPPAPAGRRPGLGARPGVIAIGASTGGVAALGQLLAALPKKPPPIVIAQHMPPGFTARFAGRLDGMLPQKIAEARSGERLGPGDVRIAPGDAHLRLRGGRGGFATMLEQAGRIGGHRPSVDVLFNSVATAAGRVSVGVILTGMGRDGAAGLKAMRRAGAYCIGQSAASCVVYGMPRAARAIDAVDEELDIALIGPRICEFLNSPADI